MPSHAVGLSQVRSPAIVMHDCPAEKNATGDSESSLTVG